MVQRPACRIEYESLQTVVPLAGFDMDVMSSTHSASMAEVPVFTNFKARVAPEQFLEDLSTPKNYGSMGEDRTHVDPREVS